MFRPHRLLLPIVVLVVSTSHSAASGLLIPDDQKLPPLAMVNHRVSVLIEDQVAITTVEQTFRNQTDRVLEATYLFPVPRGASVDRFTMWVDGKEISGELLDSKHARQVYIDIVRRTQDPGLLEYLGNNLMRLRVFPIPPKGDQKVKVSFKSIAIKDGNVVEYIYPLKTNAKSTSTLEDFSIKILIKSQYPIHNIYSPTHAITTTRKGEREVAVEFERSQAILDKDFQLFYGVGDQSIGLTSLLYKPIAGEDGYFMFLISPQIDAAKIRVSQDLVVVLDTSSSMSDIKMSQAKKALKHCLAQLQPDDRFGLIKFSTTISKFRDNLVPADKDYLAAAEKWVDGLKPSGGTAIWPALEEALAMRPNEAVRPYTIVFFTDGLPTVDETDPDKIVKKTAAKNTANTRIFTFGVGDDVNAMMLDQLAETTRAVSSYVRPAEDISDKVASLYRKMSHPVFTDLKLSVSEHIQLHEVYPPKLPDLFHGTQLVVIGRYQGQGPALIRLSGLLGHERKELIYDLNFPERTSSDTGKDFVEPLWARRKVGFLLDQIRLNGEKKELVDEVVLLAKRYGIATPYTSYLVVPDTRLPIAQPSRRPSNPQWGMGPIGGVLPIPVQGGLAGAGGGGVSGIPPGLIRSGAKGNETGSGPPMRVEDFAKSQAGDDGRALASNRGQLSEQQVREAREKLKQESDPVLRAQLTEELLRYQQSKRLWDASNAALKGRKDQYQSGQLGVELACASTQLRNQERLSLTANRLANGRNVLEVGGVWIDDAFRPNLKTLNVKAHSPAYFRILEKQPAMKDVFRLGNYLVWVTPSGVALVVDQHNGMETLSDGEIDALFQRN